MPHEIMIRAIQRRALHRSTIMAPGDFQEHVSDEKDSGAEAEHAVTEAEVVGHLQPSVSDVHAVEKRNYVEWPDKGK
jgi:hypothetical protein